MLRSVLDGRRPEDLPVAWQAPLGEVRTLLAGAATPPPSAFEAEDPGLRFRLFDAIGQILLAAARERPRLLVLDDLHRADTSSLLLLEHVLDELPGAPVVLLGAYRGAELGASEALPRMIGEARPWVARHALTGLARPDVAALLGRTLGRRPPPGLTDTVLDRTGGNPLFIEEMGRSLAAAQVGGKEAARFARQLAPQGVRQAIAAQVARLSR